MTEADVDRCWRVAEARQLVHIDEPASEEVGSFVRLVELDLLARTGDLYRAGRGDGRRLKVVVATCLWDEAQGIIGDTDVEEGAR